MPQTLDQRSTEATRAGPIDGRRTGPTVAERQAALALGFPNWRPLTLHQALDEAARDFAQRPFVITDARTWTYADMATWSRSLAMGLQRLGVRAGDKVAVVMANHPEFVALKFAISHVGAVAVPINMLSRRDELRYLLEQSDARVLVTMDAFRDIDHLQALDDIAPGWETRRLSRAEAGKPLPKLGQVVIFETGERASRPAATPLAALEGEPHALNPAPVRAADDCDIVYTSGTTGPPKGVLLTHDMLTRTAYGSAYARAFEDGRRILFSLPMYHVFGYVEGLLAVIFAGGAIVPQLRFSAEGTLDAIERHRPTDALMIPAMTLAVLDAVRERPRDLSSLRSMLASGGRAPERIWAAIRDELGVTEITTGYGMTEVTASTTVTRPDDPMERLLTTNGRLRDVGAAGDPAFGGRLVDYRVVDPETAKTLPPSGLGELRARGPGVTRGYYNKPVETAAAFDVDGWLCTGDLGRMDPDGYITLVGRLKESYRCGGEQVLPTEIEDVLTTHPDVLQAHVVPIPDERMGEVGVAFVVARSGATVEVEALRAFIASRLARYKVPRHIFMVNADEVPATASGRAQKFLLTRQAMRMLDLA